MDYIAYLHKDRNSDFGVSFPDFPGCITAGKTLDEAHRMAAEALALHIAGMVEDGDTIPDPSALDDLVVHVDPYTDRTVRINITAREKQLERINQLASQSGMTRSAYMVSSALSRSAAQRKRASTAKRTARGKERRAAM